MKRDDEFYVGYAAEAPRATARLMRLVVALAAAGAIAGGVLFVSAQRGFSPGVFEYGTLRTFTGTIITTPAPTLRGREEGGEGPDTTYLLVAPFKHGAGELAGPFDGRAVHLRGTLVQRGSHQMIEVVPDSIEESSDDRTTMDEIPLGPVDLVGEIVDSKCWLGVMKPGDGKTHRECASLCIRGGIPPLFVARGEGGSRLEALLTSPQGTPVNDAVLPFVAEPVRIRGTLSRRGDLLVLHADPATIERVR